MALFNRKTVHPFMECIEVTSESATSIDLMKIPDGTIVERVLVRVKTAATGSVNLIVGDDDDDNGFIAAADATAAAGTVYGDTGAELGDYLYDATEKKDRVKLYASPGKELKFVMSTTATTEGVYQVIVIGYTYDV
uniref:Uncharacterized protein n=1 Tax=viral metagenome TaxID=1070528 RepID=A0A6H1ZGS2_9ZZZZ